MSHDVRRKIHGNPDHVLHHSRYTKLQIWIAIHVTHVIGSMEFFWFCVVLDLAVLPTIFAQHSLIIWITYLSQTVIQLLALPALAEQSRLQQTADDERERAQGDTLTAIHRLTTEIHDYQETQIDILHGQDEILAQLKERA